MHFRNKTNNLSSLFLLIISLNSFNPPSLLKSIKTKYGFVIFCSGGGFTLLVCVNFHFCTFYIVFIKY